MARVTQPERIYVEVTSHIDIYGGINPTAIIWADGRVFPIDAVRDHRPTYMASCVQKSDCFTVIIKGKEKHLYYERCGDQFASRFGRWYVERPAL